MPDKTVRPSSSTKPPESCLYRHKFEPGKFNVACGWSNARGKVRIYIFQMQCRAYLKQVSKYSKVCKDIAVFGWSGMVLFDLNSWDLIRKCAGCGCFYAEQDNSSNLSLVLLGFLIQELGQHLYSGLLLFSEHSSYLVSLNFPNTQNRSFSCHSACLHSM